jgi:SAM-dependent methyltransferase
MSRGRDDAEYPFPLAPAELERVERQAARFARATRRVFRDAGIGPGMRVLDVGCGAGDATRLVAALVGASGAVVGVDRDAGMLAAAGRHARQEGAAPVRFVEGDFRSTPLGGPFDAAVGRFVLMFQGDLVGALRAVAAAVRPGGAVAFVEIDRTPTFPSRPQLPLWERIGALVGEGLTCTGTRSHAGLELGPALLAAGLVDVRVQVVDAFLQYPGDRFGSWSLVALLRSLMPTLVDAGIVTADGLDLSTLEDRLAAEVDAVRGVGRGPLVFGAWGVVPATGPA